MPTVTPSTLETTKMIPKAGLPQKPGIPAEGLEAPAEAPAAPSLVEDKKLSPQYAALARREMELRKRDDALKAREAALKAKDDEYAEKYIPKDKLAKDPLAAIFESGMTKDQLIDILLNGQPQIDPNLSAVQEELKQIKAAQEAQTKAQAEQQSQSYERAVAEIRKQAVSLVASNEDYATIKETDSTEAIVELIKQTYDAEGVLLSVEEAAKQVEDHILVEALKMAALTKVKAKLTPAEVIAESEVNNKKPSLAEAQQAKAPTTQPIKTLTNAATAVSSKPLSAMSRKERAILAFKGQLT